MEVYLTSKFYEEIDEVLQSVDMNVRTRHRVRKKFLDIYPTRILSEDERQILKTKIKDYFSAKGVDVSFRV